MKVPAWGDSIAISAMCNMFDVNIVVFCANAAGTSIAVNTTNTKYIDCGLLS